MSKRMKYYLAAWAVALAVFNAVVFAVPGADKYTAPFWIGYAAVTAAFAGQLARAAKALAEGDRRRFFYKVPLITVSYTGLIVTLITGSLCMAVPGLPYRVAVAAAALALGLTAIAVIKAGAAGERVAEIDTGTGERTFFIRSLTADAEALARSASGGAAKAAKEVLDAVRYSDPVSSPELSGLETEIAGKFREFSAAVGSSNGEDADRLSGEEYAARLSGELISLSRERSARCKLLK